MCSSGPTPGSHSGQGFPLRSKVVLRLVLIAVLVAVFFGFGDFDELQLAGEGSLCQPHRGFVGVSSSRWPLRETPNKRILRPAS